jgi:nitrogen regulatory protein PII
MYMIMLVLDDPDMLDEILAAWAQIGVTGATVIESTGMHRRIHQHIPMRYAYEDSDLEESGNYSLFVIVASEALVKSSQEAVEAITGNLDDPNTGVFSAWPLSVVKGVPGHNNS